MFTCGTWLDRCLDMAYDAGSRLEWERLGSKYAVSLHAADVHSETGATLDSAAFALVQKLRPEPQP